MFFKYPYCEFTLLLLYLSPSPSQLNPPPPCFAHFPHKVIGMQLISLSIAVLPSHSENGLLLLFQLLKFLQNMHSHQKIWSWEPEIRENLCVLHLGLGCFIQNNLFYNSIHLPENFIILSLWLQYSIVYKYNFFITYQLKDIQVVCIS